jgi:hypothetical protein
MTNREPRSQWANEGSDVWPPRVAANGTRRSRSIGFTQSLIEITPQMISLSHEIETLHILLEHFYDSQRKQERG